VAAVPSVAVVTDTTHYLPRELVERFELHQVSLYVNWNGRTDREADLPDFDEYYDHLRSATELPTTSQPSVGDFLAVYEPLVREGRDIVSIHLSGGISGTVRAAEQAREELLGQGVDSGRIAVYDSATAAAGMGVVAIAAASAARRGADTAGVVAAASALRADLKLWFAVDTMEFLKRGGRVGAARAWLGSTLRIKPILSIEAEVLPVERVRTSGRAFERMVEYLALRHEDGHDAWFLQHIQAHGQVERLVERGREIFGTEPEFVSEIGPVVGTHAGPGLLGVSAVRRDLLEARAATAPAS
jgi:DegV family protein with EDD domain